MKFMNDKKIRLIVTTCILTLVLIIGVITSVNFLKFRNYNTEFVVREDVVGKIYKFSEFSKHLKGDVADSNIYEIQGTDNTVAIVKKDKLANYNKIDNIKGLSVCGVDGSSQYDAAKDVFTSNINVLATANDVYENVKSGTYEVGDRKSVV